MDDEILPLLKLHEYFHGLRDDVLQEVVKAGQVTHYSTGSVVHEANALHTRVGFVLRGRLKATRVSGQGVESYFRTIERGEQFGMLAGALGEPLPIRIVALESSTLLSLDYEQSLELTLAQPELRRLWLKAYAANFRKHFLESGPKRKTMILALIHESSATRRMAEQLVHRLHQVGEKLAVFSDSDQWRTSELRFRSLHENGQELSHGEIRRQVAEWRDSNRIIFDIQADKNPERAVRTLELVDRAVFFAPAAATDAAIRRLEMLEVSAHGWRDKISIAWLLENGRQVIPDIPNLSNFVSRDFKIWETPPQFPFGRSMANGIERLLQELRGVRIGVALGGGAARGMAHLGVLKALEQNGIAVDMIAGTSSGAMTGVAYASGFDSDYCANQFGNDLRPGSILRRLPQGAYWYLLYKFRRREFERMLRRYFHDWNLEQLAIPCVAVTLDLVSGEAVVRDRGDAVEAILESINLPVLSVPICIGNQALIDGGLVNNLPADVLVSKGCNLVIAVSVTAKLEKRFCNTTPESTTSSKMRPTIVQTLFRILVVQNHSLNALGEQPADVVIEPDVTNFDLAEFSRAKELAAVGEATAIEQIPKIRQLLDRLDPELFRVGRSDGAMARQKIP